MQHKPQTFNDGVCGFYTVTNAAPAAKKPIRSLTLKIGSVRYASRTVGISRYWSARQANVHVDRLLRMPCLDTVSTQDIAITEDGTQYAIKQIQYPEDIYPAVMDITLERVTQRYDTI